MIQITLRVLEGADRGQVFEGLQTPITIGREEGNIVQLNDERVSRYHLKIQEDKVNLVLTDLESTNGTKVNGESTQLRILRYGDTIGVGRSTLLFGSRDQIARRLAKIKNEKNGKGNLDKPEEAKKVDSLDFEVNWEQTEEEVRAIIDATNPPPLPEEMTASQAAQLAEMLQYLHSKIRLLTEDLQTSGKKISLSQQRWQLILELQSRLAEYLRLSNHPHL
ncbi:MAG: FHA domain-containing protein [Pirellulaceae bacterium]|nr:FHA domain-containing protein [Pirellulaceae bacterium]